jgi:hypothetical protein
VPLVLAAEVRGYIALGRRHHREPYLSEDLRLLESLADQLEFALENIGLERKRREQELREKELKILAGKAELRALRAQINPHFLFNALNTIASLIEKDPARAEETVEMLADVFRYTLARSGSDFIPLSDELEFINAYLEIEKARFGRKLVVEMRIEPETQGIRIPSMLLQPLVENAVKHGIAPKLQGGKITISSNCDNGLLRLEVADTGVGFDSRSAGRLHNGGVGVRNVRDRLRNIYGSEDLLQIFSGRFPIYPYMYTLRQFMRMNRVKKQEIEDFVVAVSGKKLSVREIEQLAHGYFRGPESLREAIQNGHVGLPLEWMKQVPEDPDGCNEFEGALLRDLDATLGTVRPPSLTLQCLGHVIFQANG